jgi:hypothetical protein
LGDRVSVWSHSPVWLSVAAINAAWLPEWTGPATTWSPAWHVQGLNVPLSNPPLLSAPEPVEVDTVNVYVLLWLPDVADPVTVMG